MPKNSWIKMLTDKKNGECGDQVLGLNKLVDARKDFHEAIRSIETKRQL